MSYIAGVKLSAQLISNIQNSDLSFEDKITVVSEILKSLEEFFSSKDTTSVTPSRNTFNGKTKIHKRKSWIKEYTHTDGKVIKGHYRKNSPRSYKKGTFLGKY